MRSSFRIVDKRATQWCDNCQEEHPLCECCGLGSACHWSSIITHHHHIIVPEVIHEFYPLYFRRSWPEHIIFVCSKCHGKLHHQARVLVEAFEYRFKKAIKEQIAIPWKLDQLSADEALKKELELRYQLGEELLKGLLNLAFVKKNLSSPLFFSGLRRQSIKR